MNWREAPLVEKTPKWASAPLLDVTEDPEQVAANAEQEYEFAVAHNIDIGLAADLVQSVREIPQNLKIGTVGIGASLLEAVKKRSIQLSGGGILPDDAVRAQFEVVKPQERMTPNLATEMFGLKNPLPGSIAAEAFGVVSRLPDVGSKLIRRKQGEMQARLPEKAGKLTKLARLVNQNTPTIAASVAASLLTGDPVVGLAMIGELEGGQSFQTQLDRGGSVRKALILSDLSEAAEVGGEMLVFPKFIKGLKTGIPLQKAFTLILENAGQEGITGFNQQFIETFGTETSKGTPIKEAVIKAFDSGIKAIPENALVGGITAGMLDIPGVVVQTIVEGQKVEDTSKQDLAAAEQKAIDEARTPPKEEAPQAESRTEKPVATEQEPSFSSPTGAAPTPAAPSIETANTIKEVNEAVRSITDTSARQADLQRDRASLGLDGIASPERKSWQKTLQSAKDQKIADRALRIASEINSKPRPLTDEETAGLVIKAAQLKNEYRQLMNKLSAETDGGQIQITSAEAQRVEAEFESLTQALYKSGTEKGRALASQKLTLNEDFDLISVKTRAKARKGAELTAQEADKLKALTDELETVKRTVDELQRQMSDMTARNFVREGGRRRFGQMSKEQRMSELNRLVNETNTLLKEGCYN